MAKSKRIFLVAMSTAIIASNFLCQRIWANSTVANSDGTVFQTPEAALTAVKAAFASEDPKQLIALYGKIGTDMSAFRIDNTWPRVQHPELGLRP